MSDSKGAGTEPKRGRPGREITASLAFWPVWRPPSGIPGGPGTRPGRKRALEGLGRRRTP